MITHGLFDICHLHALTHANFVLKALFSNTPRVAIVRNGKMIHADVQRGCKLISRVYFGPPGCNWFMFENLMRFLI